MYLESYKQLEVWKRSIELVKEIYRITDQLPKSELYGLASQMRRAAVSIPSNLETQIIIAKEIYPPVNFSKAESLLEEIQKMLITMIKKLNAKRYTLNPNSGQSLVEIMVAIGIGAILIGGATAVIVPILRSNLETRNVQIANSLTQEYLDKIQSLAESDWYIIYSPPSAKGPSSQFYLAPTSTTFMLVSGTTSTVVEARTFTRYFSIENVNRKLCGADEITTDATSTCTSGPGSSGVADDPSTQKITATVSWPEGRSISKIQYLTRSVNRIFRQTDWSGGSGQEGPITSENNQFATSSNINYSTTTGSIIINL
jgi:type II secretory pathway pseudopilin PulG